jgi:hypothetical protein
VAIIFPVGRWSSPWTFSSFHLVPLLSSRALGTSLFGQHIGSFYGQKMENAMSFLLIFHLSLGYYRTVRVWKCRQVSGKTTSKLGNQTSI